MASAPSSVPNKVFERKIIQGQLSGGKEEWWGTTAQPDVYVNLGPTAKVTIEQAQIRYFGKKLS